jgi:hypothetical protein
MTDSTAPDDIEVWISAPKAVVVDRGPGGFDNGGEVETHSKVIDKVFNTVRGDSSEFIDSWKKAFHAVGAVFAADPGTDQTGPFGLESVTAKLSLTASGKVVFVGELGGEIAFEAVFTRRTAR